MEILCEVKKEESRLSSDGKTEYNSITVVEAGAESTIMQHLEYCMAQEEKDFKGKLLGKFVKIKVVDIQDGFHGRQRIYGSMRVVPGPGSSSK